MNGCTQSDLASMMRKCLSEIFSRFLFFIVFIAFIIIIRKHLPERCFQGLSSQAQNLLGAFSVNRLGTPTPVVVIVIIIILVIISIIIIVIIITAIIQMPFQ